MTSEKKTPAERFEFLLAFPKNDHYPLIWEMNGLEEDSECTADELVSWIVKNHKGSWATWPRAAIHMLDVVWRKSHNLVLVFRALQHLNGADWPVETGYLGRDTQNRKSYFGRKFSDATIEQQIAFVEWVLATPQSDQFGRWEILDGMLPRMSFGKGTVLDHTRKLVLSRRPSSKFPKGTLEDGTRLLLELARTNK